MAAPRSAPVSRAGAPFPSWRFFPPPPAPSRNEAEGRAAPPGDAPADLPLLDETQAAALWADLPLADRDRIVARFLTETERDLATLAALPPDAAGIADLAHRAAGSCALFGLAALRAALGRIETAARRRHPLAGSDLEDLQALWRESRDRFEAWQRSA